MMAPTHHMMGVAIILQHMMSYDGWAFFAAILIKLKYSCPGQGISESCALQRGITNGESHEGNEGNEIWSQEKGEK